MINSFLTLLLTVALSVLFGREGETWIYLVSLFAVGCAFASVALNFATWLITHSDLTGGAWCEERIRDGQLSSIETNPPVNPFTETDKANIRADVQRLNVRKFLDLKRPGDGVKPTADRKGLCVVNSWLNAAPFRFFNEIKSWLRWRWSLRQLNRK